MTEQLRIAGLFFTTKLSTGCSVNTGSFFSDPFWTEFFFDGTTLLDMWDKSSKKVPVNLLILSLDFSNSPFALISKAVETS